MSETNNKLERLPERWSKYLAEQPETGMDYQTGDVVLNDGTVIKDVAFVGATYVGEVKGHEGVPFKSEDIAEIHLTHKRWRFSKRT